MYGNQELKFHRSRKLNDSFIYNLFLILTWVPFILIVFRQFTATYVSRVLRWQRCERSIVHFLIISGKRVWSARIVMIGLLTINDFQTWKYALTSTSASLIKPEIVGTSLRLHLSRTSPYFALITSATLSLFFYLKNLFLHSRALLYSAIPCHWLYYL
jgi:hypothetical protein